MLESGLAKTLFHFSVITLGYRPSLDNGARDSQSPRAVGVESTKEVLHVPCFYSSNQ